MTSFNQTAATMHNDSSMIEKDIMAEIQEFVRPQVYKWIFLFVFAILFLVGTVGNFLVCYSVWRSHSLKNVTNYFLVNLAAADFFVILICLPASVSYDMLSSWFLGLVMCKLSVYLQVGLHTHHCSQFKSFMLTVFLMITVHGIMNIHVSGLTSAVTLNRSWCLHICPL